MERLLPEKIYLDPSQPITQVLVRMPPESKFYGVSTKDTKLTFSYVNNQNKEVPQLVDFPIEGNSQWIFTLVETNKSNSFSSAVINPLLHSNEYSKLIEIIGEIDQVLEMKVKGGGVTTLTINNKTLVSESMESLMKMRNSYVKRANALQDQLEGRTALTLDKPIVSITRFGRRGI